MFCQQESVAQVSFVNIHVHEYSFVSFLPVLEKSTTLGHNLRVGDELCLVVKLADPYGHEFDKIAPNLKIHVFFLCKKISWLKIIFSSSK